MKEKILLQYGFHKEFCNEFEGDEDYYLCFDLEDIDSKFYQEALLTRCKSEVIDDNFTVCLFNGNFHDIETEEDLVSVVRIFCKHNLVKK